jgi:hypothetical protein
MTDEHQGPNPQPLTEGHPLPDEDSLEPLMALMGEGMSELPSDTDMDKLIAAVDIVGRAGGMDFECGYDDSKTAPNWWYANCRTRDGQSRSGFHNRISSEHPGPAEAAEKLARKLINGGTCTHCGRVITLSRTGLAVAGDGSAVCFWTRQGKRWERGCTELVEEGVRQAEVIDAFLKAGKAGTN